MDAPWLPWAALTAIPFGWILLIAFQPGAPSFVNGWRCVCRHPRMIRVLGVLGTAYSAFRCAVEARLAYSAGEGFSGWIGSGTVDRLACAKSAALPALENLAALFHQPVATFPVSAVVAVLWLLNSGRYRSVASKALAKRFGAWGAPLGALVCVFAVAAILKPLAYIAGPFLTGAGWGWIAAAWATDWLSFLFEALFATLVQVWLILRVHLWIRGAGFAEHEFAEFAVRRMGAVLRWTLLVVGIATGFIHLPLLLANLVPDLQSVAFAWVDLGARPLIALFALAFASVQVSLVFHAESLRAAFRHHRNWIRSHASAWSWFILTCTTTLYLAALLDQLALSALGPLTAIGIAWRIAFPWIAALLHAWLLATWVCLFRRDASGHVAF